MGDGEIHLKGPKLSNRAFDCTTREPTHGTQQEHEEIPHQEILERPQGIHLPPQSYWEQLNTSLGDLNSNMEQLRMEHQEHSIILNEIREDQKAMREEQQRQERDIEELKNSIGSLRGRRSHHH